MDVKELLEKNRIEYIVSGRDFKIKCLNPKHDDSNPSMRVDRDSGIFNCLSCHHSGNLYTVFGFNTQSMISIKIERIRRKITNILSMNSVPAPVDALAWNKGYREISADTYKKFKAFTTSTIPELENRLVFPITDIRGNTVAFQGRALFSDEVNKYEAYPRHTSLPLFPQKVKPIYGSIILVEGMFDMLNLHDKGLTNAVCTFGTAFGGVKKKAKKLENIDKLMQYKYQGVNKIYIMYDGDKSGRDSAANLLDYIDDYFMCDTVDLDEGVDPGSLTQEDVDNLKGALYGESSTG